MGKRKYFEQKSVQEEEDVKFAKRRNTLYKKAQELSILCGSDIAVVVISRSTGKVSTYGSPDPGIVIGRYQSQKKNAQDGARSASRKVVMTKDGYDAEENTMQHLLVPYQEENLGTIPNPEPVSTEPFLLPGLMEIPPSSSSWMPSSSSIQSSQSLATSYGGGGGLDGLSYFDFDASSSGLIDPKSLNQEESGATYGFNGLSTPDSQGCGFDPNFLNQERGAQYDGSSIPISYSSSSSTSSSVSSVLPPSSSTDCLQPMATPPTGYGFDDPLSLDVIELEPSFDVGEFLDELYQSHPISPSSSSWMPSSSSIQSSQPLATSYGCGLDGLSYFDFDASSSGLIDPKSLNQEGSGATYGSAPMIYSSSSFSSSGSGFGFLSSSSDYGCGFNGLSAPDSMGCGLDPNFLNQERGAQYDGSSIPISYSSSYSSVSSVLPPSSSIDCLQPMATPPTGYGFDDPFSLESEFLDELNRSHPISPSSNGHGFNDDDPLLFDVNDDDPLFFDMIDDDPHFFDVNEFFK